MKNALKITAVAVAVAAILAAAGGFASARVHDDGAGVSTARVHDDG